MFNEYTSEYIKNSILSKINLDIAKNEGSILNAWASASAEIHADFFAELEDIKNRAFLIDCSSEDIDKKIVEFGAERKTGEKARGKIKIIGTINTEIPDGFELDYNGLTYQVMGTMDGIKIGEEGAEAVIYAIEPGRQYNIENGVYLKPIKTLEGIDEIYTITEIENGENKEEDIEVLTRFFDEQKHKATSGNPDHYRKWAREVDGVKDAKVIRTWNGPGTVKVILLADHNRNVDSKTMEAAKAYIEHEAPVGAKVTVVTPSLLTINVNATIEVLDGYDLEEIQEEYTSLANNYLYSASEEVTYTKMLGLLAQIPGVNDFKNFKVNGGTSNIKIKGEQVGSIGTIEFQGGEVD